MPHDEAGADRVNGRPKLLDQWQRTPVVALIGVMILLLVGIGVGVYSEHLYRTQSQQEVQVQAGMLAASVRLALEFEDASIARENVRSLIANPAVVSAGVYDARGNQFAGFVRDGARLPARPPADGAISANGRLALTMPVIAGGERVGSVYLRTSLEPFAQRMVRFGGIILLAIMGGLVAVVVGAAAAALRRSNAELSVANEQLRAEMAERAKAEEQLRQAQKMQAVGQLTGGIAHDFNNLLTPIMGGLEIISTVSTEPRVKGLAENALEAARRGAKLTGQLLAFSRTHRLSTAAVPINGVIDGMQSMLRHSIGPSVDIRLALDPTCGTALCDANQIENAILNLSINARDAMPNGGTLTIATSKTIIEKDGELAAGDYAVIAITDTGTGMTPEVLARATEPFFTTKPVGKGTGLGLAQVYGVAQQFGGTLRIESKVGKGTTIRIFLPCAAATQDAVETSVEDRTAMPIRPGAEILIVDDDADVRAFLTDTLQSLGYRVRAAESGDEGLRLLALGTPDLMLVDYAMPGLSGADVARVARAAYPKLPIVFVTGYADSEALDAALGPAAPVLHKPFGVRELVTAIDRNFAQEAA